LPACGQHAHPQRDWATAAPGCLVHQLPHLAHEVGEDDQACIDVLRSKHGVRVGLVCAVELDAVDAVAGHGLFDEGEALLPGFGGREVGPNRVLGQVVGGQPQAGVEVHAVVVRSIDQHPEWVTALVEQTEHGFPGTPVGHVIFGTVEPDLADLCSIRHGAADPQAEDEGVDHTVADDIHRVQDIEFFRWWLDRIQVGMAGVVIVEHPRLGRSAHGSSIGHSSTSFIRSDSRCAIEH
jgi:hypothetical protein